MSIAARYADVCERVATAAERAGRARGDVAIVAASKTWSAEVLLEAVAAGITIFGENRAQELRDKAAVVGARARWHFIGHLQTNKVRNVVGAVELVHSVDRLALAEAMSRRAAGESVVQDVLVEVNVSGEAAKHGVEPERALDLARAVDRLEGISVRGLMTMPPYPLTPEDSRPFYRALAEMRAELVAFLPRADALSMGMSRDFEVAVEEGATLARVGEAIFGPRPRPPPSSGD